VVEEDAVAGEDPGDVEVVEMLEDRQIMRWTS